MLSSYTVIAPRILSSVVKHEYEGEFTRERETLLAGSGSDRTVEMGTLVGKITASGKVVAWAPGASDGSEDIYGLLVDDCTASNGVDNDGALVIVRGPAVFFEGGIQWPAGVTANQKTAAVAALTAKNIIVRRTVY
jgi:hypothetical protein